MSKTGVDPDLRELRSNEETVKSQVTKKITVRNHDGCHGMEDREHGGYDTTSRKASVSGETGHEWELSRIE